MGLFGKKVECSMCGMKLRSEKDLKEHARTRHEERPSSSGLTCASCGVSFRNESEMKQHAQRAHGM